MIIGLYDKKILLQNFYREAKVLGSFPNVKMYSTIQFGGFVEIQGNVYVMTYYDVENDFLVVREVPDFEMNPTALKAEEFTCPHCKSINYDAWEMEEDEGEHFCHRCSSDLKYKRERSPKKPFDYYYIIESLKIADYTNMSNFI